MTGTTGNGQSSPPVAQGGTPVSVGYFVNPEYPVGQDLQGAVRDQQNLVATARDLGMEAIIVGEHFSREASVWLPPLLLLSALVDRGEGLLFGTGILSAPLHNPVVLAEQAAFLDVATGGRFVLGLSAGWNGAEMASVGASPHRRGQRLTEMVKVLRSLWSGEGPTTYVGECLEVRDVSVSLRPVREEGIPIWLGGSSDPALRRAAEIGDTWLVSSHFPGAAIEEQSAKYRAFLADAGRTVPHVRPGLRNLFVARTREEAVRIAAPALTASYQMFSQWGLFRDVLEEGPSPVDLAKAQERALVGSPEEVAEQLVTFVNATDVNLLLVRSQWLGMEARHIARCLELVVTEVLPLVNAARRASAAIPEDAG